VSATAQARSRLLGRDRELASLVGLAGLAAGGEGQVAIVSGEAGIGKSALVAELIAWCDRHRFTVLAGVADEIVQSRPFGVVEDALASAAGRIAEPGAGSPAGISAAPDAEWRLAELAGSTVARICDDGPVVVVLDDLQWADEPSLLAVRAIAQLAGSLPLPLLLVGVLRPYPAGAALRALLATLDYRRATRIGLTGLEPAAVAEIAAEIAGAPAGESLRLALAKAGGNPFYVTEMMTALLREPAATVSATGGIEVGSWSPASLAGGIQDELRYLPEQTLSVLRAAAVVGRVFSVRELALISPSSVADVVQALLPAERAGLVMPEGERLAFRHDLIREAIYEELPLTSRRALHRDLAGKLAERGAGIEQTAGQLMLGAEPGDIEAIGMLRRAATAILPRSAVIASDLLWRARTLAVEGSPARLEVVIDLVRPLMWTGQASRTEEVCAEGLGHGPPDEEAPLLWMGLVNSRILQGRFAEARETAAHAIAESGGLTDSDRLHLRTASTLSGVMMGDPQALEQAREIVAREPTSIPKGIAQEAIAQWELFTGRADRALQAYEQVDAMREPAQLESRIWQRSGIRVRMWEAVALLDLDRIEQAIALLQREIAGRLPVPALPHALMAACRFHAGDLPAAVAECEAATAAAEAAGGFIPASAPALAAAVALRRGHVEDAERLIEQAEHVRSPSEFGGDTVARWSRVLILEARGETDRAADAAQAALEAYGRAGFVSFFAWHGPDLVRVLLGAGRRELAEHAAAAAERAAAQLPVASRRQGALRARGLLTDDPAIVLEAVAVARTVARPVDLALALRDSAVVLGRAGRGIEARPLAYEALELLGAVGAAGTERAARKELRSAGVKLASRASHAAASHGWESLSDTERQVVRLVIGGRTNQQIGEALHLSPRTIGWHLGNIYRKLDVSSRGVLAAEAVRRGFS